MSYEPLPSMSTPFCDCGAVAPDEPSKRLANVIELCLQAVEDNPTGAVRTSVILAVARGAEVDWTDSDRQQPARPKGTS